MFFSSIYFFPTIVALVWLCIYLCRHKNTSQRTLSVLLMLEILHSASQAFYVSPATNYLSMCYWDIISQPLILCTVAVANIYIHYQLSGSPMSVGRKQIFFIPAIAQAVAVWILYFQLGISNVARFIEAVDKATIEHPGAKIFDVLPKEFDTQPYHMFHFFDGILFDSWCLILGICLIILCFRVLFKHGYHFGDGFKFWFKGASTTSQRATSCMMVNIIITYLLRVVLGRTYLYYNPELAIAMAIFIAFFIYCLCYAEYFNHLPSYTLHDLTHADIIVCEEMALVNFEREEEPEPEDTHNTVDTEALSERVEERNNTLADALKQELEVNKAFKDRNLTLEVLAKRLGTNRNKLSGIVSMVYGMDFRNAVAKMRIEEAKEFMLKNRTATAETIAIHCGFKDASAFFHRFKDFTGDTPRMWISKR